MSDNLPPHDDTFSMGPLRPDGPPTASEQLASMPESIGQYKLLSIIGVGGMGVVYKAMQQHPKRAVAIKVLRVGEMTPTRLQRLIFEGELLGKLNHRCIAKVFEVGSFEMFGEIQPFVAMELIEGKTLLHYLDKNELSLDEKLSLLIEIGEGVSYAHQNGVVHRDLKPSNILVTDQGEVRILDFGVASYIDPDEQMNTMLTDMGQLVGTLTYMSPEQATGNNKEIDTRSDVYAIGGIAYRILSGQLSHDVKSTPLHESVRKICEEVPSLLGMFDASYKGDIETIVSKAMEKEKDRRYQSVNSFVEDLRRHQRHEPIEARPTSAVYILSRFIKRNRVAVLAGTVVLATLLLATIFSTYKAVEAREATVVAQGRLEQIQHVASTLVFDLTDRVGNIPGATPLREAIAMTGLETLLSLEKEVEGNEKLAIEIANAWMRLGDIFGNPDVANLGRTNDASNAYNRAEALLLAVSSVPPKTLAELHKRIADMHVVSGDIEQAHTAYVLAKEYSQQAATAILIAEIDGRLAAILNIKGMTGEATVLLRTSLNVLFETDGLESSLSLVRLLYQLGELEKTAGRSEDAAELFGRAKRHLQEYLENDTNNQLASELLASITLQVGDSLLLLGRVNDGIEQLKQAVYLYEQLFKIDPLNVHLQDALAKSHLRLSRAQFSDGQLEESLEQVAISISICRTAIEELQSRKATILLSSALLHLGEIELRKVSPERAVLALQESLDLLRSISKEETIDTSLVSASATAAIELAEAIGRVSGDPLKAAASMLPSLAMLEKLAEDNPDNMPLRAAIRHAYINVRTAYMQAGKLEVALRYSIKNLDNAQTFLAKDPADARAKRTVSVAIGHVGEVQSRMGRHDEARVNFDRAIILLEELLKVTPEDPKLLRGLSFRYCTVGDMLKRQGEYQNALEYYSSCLKIDTSLVLLAPTNSNWLHDLAVTNQRIADTYVLLDDAQSAMVYFHDAVQCTDKMREIEPRSAHIARTAIATEGRYAEFLFKYGDYALAKEIALELRGIAKRLRDVAGDGPYDRTLWTSMEALAGRCSFALSKEVETERKRREELALAQTSLQRAIVVLLEMEANGTAQGYNIKLLRDMEEVLAQVEAEVIK